MLAGFDDAELDRVARLTAWLIAHPDSGLYPRQIPLPGLHAKWFDQRQGLIAALVAAVRAVPDPPPCAALDAAPASSGHAALGLRSPPVTLRVRALDAGLRAGVGGLGDLIAPVADLARLDWKPNRVLMVENLQTGLALPETRSLLMDEATLARHRDRWLEEPRQHGVAELSRLQAAEQAVYRALRMQHWGRNVRLEQERIGWDFVLAALDGNSQEYSR